MASNLANTLIFLAKVIEEDLVDEWRISISLFSFKKAVWFVLMASIISICFLK